MKVKKYLHPKKKEKKVDLTSHCKQVTKGLRHAKWHVFQNYLDDVFQEQNQHKHHLYKKQEEEQSPFVDYIVVAMITSLYDQIAHVQVFSSHHYKQQKLMENIMMQS
jgi:hypothetical protein